LQIFRGFVRGSSRSCVRPAMASAALTPQAEILHQPKLSELDSRSPRQICAHFNARDFDAIRAMIADDVRSRLVNKTL